MSTCHVEVVALSALLVSLAATQQQGPVTVAGHTIPSTVRVMNGSQADVGCTGIQPNAFTCLSLSPGTAGGNTSFLVDGSVPESLNFSGNTWARELMTVNHNGVDFNVLVDIDSMNATRAELVLFNCPDWGIGAVAITVTVGGGANVEELGSTMLQNTSCDSLLTVCVPLQPQTTFSTYTVNFQNASDAGIDWTHIAEVTFYNDSVECGDPFLVTPEAPTEQPTTTDSTPPSTGTPQVDTSPPITSTAPTTPQTEGRSLFTVGVVLITAAGVLTIGGIAVAIVIAVIVKRKRTHRQEAGPVYDDLTPAGGEVATTRNTAYAGAVQPRVMELKENAAYASTLNQEGTEPAEYEIIQ